VAATTLERTVFLRDGKPGRLPYRPFVHGPPLAVCGSLWIGTHLWRVRRPPMSVVWNEVDSHGRERVNRLDRWARGWLRWTDTARARLLSNVLAHYAMPASATAIALLGARRAPGGPLADLLCIEEAVLYAGAVSQAVKLLLRRQRPFARFSPPGSTAPAKGPDDDNLSFFSSHTSTATALATVSYWLLRRRRVRSPLVGVLGLGALATGYFRIASDRHYLSDVLAGAAVGASVGTAVPALLHRA
jgi:membrane-associated phospholipid phosphatase